MSPDDKPHDRLFRSTFSVPAHAAALLRSILPPEVCAEIDWGSLSAVKGDRITKVLRERNIDLLLSARIAGREVCLMFLVEHQSKPEKRMVVRMLEYMAVLWRAMPAKEPLVPILPIVVHHGASGWTAARSMRELLRLDADLEALLGDRLVSMTLTIDDLARLTPEQIAARRASAQVRLVLGMLRDARMAESVGELLSRWAALVREALAEDPTLDAVVLVLRYISKVRDERLDDVLDAARQIGQEAEEATMTLYERLIAEGEAKGIAKGIAKGKAEGMAEGEAKGMAALILRQLARFGPISPEVAARVRAASVEELVAMADRMASAKSIAEVVG